MSAKFSPNIRSFVASSLIDNIVLQQLNEWETTTAYTEGDLVYYGSNKYVAVTSGTSGGVPPEHVQGVAVSDGGVDWLWTGNTNIDSAYNKNVYLTIGKDDEWADENNPDVANISDQEDYTTIKNILVAKKVTSSNFRLAIPRYDWTSGTVYDAYDDSKDPLAIPGDDDAYDNPWFVFTSDYRIYKCLDNFGGATSTIEPTSTSTSPFATSDSYIWKFMGELDADSVYYLTADFVPVRYKLTDDGSVQWDVQQAATAGSWSGVEILFNSNTANDFPGAGTPNVKHWGAGTETVTATVSPQKDVNDVITQIRLSNIGSGYDLSQETYLVVYPEDITGITHAEVDTVTVTAGAISAVTFSSFGAGYTEAELVFYDIDNNTANIEDIDVTVSGGVLTGSITINDGGTGYSDNVIAFVVPRDSGSSLNGAVLAKAIYAPKEGHGYNIVSELEATTAIVQVRLTENTDYLLTGEPDGTFRQVGLMTDLREKDTLELATQTIYAGPAHTDWGGATLNELDDTYGYVLYINNVEKIVRSEGQEEDIKIAITF